MHTHTHTMLTIHITLLSSHSHSHLHSHKHKHRHKHMNTAFMRIQSSSYAPKTDTEPLRNERFPDCMHHIHDATNHVKHHQITTPICHQIAFPPGLDQRSRINTHTVCICRKTRQKYCFYFNNVTQINSLLGSTLMHS